jgi:hypothetical protein
LKTGVKRDSGSIRMSSLTTRSKSAPIEAAYSDEWRLVTENEAPHVFRAEGLVAMFGEVDARKKIMREMEK